MKVLDELGCYLLAGAGAVGRSVARGLIGDGHRVLSDGLARSADEIEAFMAA